MKKLIFVLSLFISSLALGAPFAVNGLNNSGPYTQSGTAANTLTGAVTVPALTSSSIANSGGYTQTGTAANTLTGAVTAPTITATTQFTGPGTGLTGTAASLNIGGNAATATGVLGGNISATSIANSGPYTQTGTAANTLTGAVTVPALTASSVANSGAYTQTGTAANTLTGSVSAPSLINSQTGSFIFSSTYPVIASGFGTSAVISTLNGTASFTIYVGTGGTASSGTITLPAQNYGWVCTVGNPLLGPAGAITEMENVQGSATITFGNYTISNYALTAWPSASYIHVICIPD